MSRSRRGRDSAPAARLIVAIAGLAIGFALFSRRDSRHASLCTSAVFLVNPWTIGVTVAMLLVVVAGACWLPARRAARIEPALALRAE